MKPTIHKAVFPVAGLGTRFLPATKAVPKEMLTVVDRPVIQHAVDEARDAGFDHFVFVTGRNKQVIEDHFDKQFELEATLRARGKTEQLALLEQDTPGAGQASFTRQQEPKGLGHAVWCAREIVGNEPFALALPDMLPHGREGCLTQMMRVYERLGGNIVAVEEVPWEETHLYGVVEVGEDLGDGAFTIKAMVEKPAPGKAPSNLMIMGRYILQPEIFGLLENQKTGAGGEVQITDAMIELMNSQPFYGVRFNGRTFDCGSKLGFLLANVTLALERDEIAPALRAELETLLK
ncbi:MAG: UTP--glucose-1-phosphate uridylyltransferase GalU [Alphaproteobacteria bacterium]